MNTSHTTIDLRSLLPAGLDGRSRTARRIKSELISILGEIGSDASGERLALAKSVAEIKVITAQAREAVLTGDRADLAALSALEGRALQLRRRLDRRPHHNRSPA